MVKVCTVCANCANARTTIAIVVMPGLNLENLHVSVITFLSGQSHNTFVQISLAQDTSWAKTHLGGGG